MPKLSFLFLGTGSSMGIPVIGCNCPACKSQDPFDARLRPGYLLEYQGKTLLIDASQDLRCQAIRYGISHLDGVFITHSHHDHTAGIDDLRAFNHLLYESQKRSDGATQSELPLLMSEACYADLAVRYRYIFEPAQKTLSSVTETKVHYVKEEGGSIEFAGMRLFTFPFYQMGMRVDGLRIGAFGFVSDIKDYEDQIFENLKGVEYLVVSALREQWTPIHFNVEEAIEFSRKIGAKHTWFVHIAHEVEHQIVQKKLPPGFSLAYDGLKIEIEVGK